MGKIFCFMGKSASGKDTIFKAVFSDFIQIKNITLFTTRPIREGETNGKEYHFVTENEFNEMVAEGLIIESRSYNTVHGIWTYFIASSAIDLENNSYMVINTLEGYNSLKQYYGDDVVVPIYIEVEDGLRLSRALKRELEQDNPKYEEMCRRFLADQKDFSEDNLVSSNIRKKFINHDFAECVLEIEEEISKYLEKEKQYRI